MRRSLRIVVALGAAVAVGVGGGCGPAVPGPASGRLGAAPPRVAGSAGASRPTAPRPTPPPELFGGGFGSARDAREVVARLQALKAAATAPAERQLLDRLAAAVTLIDQTATRTAGFRDLLEVVRSWGQLYADDFETQLQVASTVAVLADQAESIDLPAQPLRRERVDLARRLVARFPAQARAHGQLGWALRLSGADPLEVLPHFVRCLDLEAGNAVCRKAFDTLAAELRQPRCLTAEVHPGLALVGATASRAPGRRTVEWRDQTLQLEDQPLVGPGGIAAISVDPNGAELRLTPAASKQFAAETARLAASGDFAVLVRDRRVLLAARVMSAIEGGRMRISDLRIEDLCRRVERREVPPALRR
jgi:hypothetical protein